MTLAEAIEFVSMMVPIRSYDGTGGLWFGRNQNMADATFIDWGAARATAIILNAVHERRLVLREREREGCDRPQPKLVLAVNPDVGLVRDSKEPPAPPDGARHDLPP